MLVPRAGWPPAVSTSLSLVDCLPYGGGLHHHHHSCAYLLATNMAAYIFVTTGRKSCLFVYLLTFVFVYVSKEASLANV